MSVQTAILWVLLVGLLCGLGALLALRWMDARADRAEWQRLRATQPAEPALFTPDMVADLPEPARRFFLFAVQPGTPLHTVAELTMEGKFSLGTRENPAYKTMRAMQILAAPHGFVWKLNIPGPVPISGSDAGTWTRFRILGLIPVARAGGSEDHARSAFGRYVAEAVFWTPAALLPGPGVAWAAVDANTARVTVTHGAYTQAVDVAVDVDGRPHQVSFMRWTNANPEKVFRLQPFGGLLSDFRNVDGFMLPFQADAGNHIGTDDWFPFFKANITAIRFPATSTQVELGLSVKGLEATSRPAAGPLTSPLQAEAFHDPFVSCPVVPRSCHQPGNQFDVQRPNAAPDHWRARQPALRSPG